MNRKKYITITLMLFLLGINKTYAACTQEELDNFKKIEDEYKITYEFDKEEKKYTLLFERTNPNMYDFMIDTRQKIQCKDINSNITKCYYLEPGEYKFYIIGQTKSCNDKLKTIEMTLPKYNIFSTDQLCEGIEEFVLCQPTYDKEIDYETFKSRVETYKKTKNEKKNEVPEEEPSKDIKTYIEENLIQIIIVVVFIILVLITTIITAKSIRKSRRLE